ncbi:hypothetical protein QEG73_21390 [Chitinophagaceae bacterium 26-R-25]|nr:hypothetical protein [Chitinophagaceae bacterium 26-R-25]
MPPSPTATAFARYGEIPVDISSGVPQVEIPIYTITSRKLSVPLALSYHASGIKPDDVSSPVGLGWVLKGMGLVSRTVMDRPDEEPSPSAGSTEGGRATYISESSYSTAYQNAVMNHTLTSFGSDLNIDLTRKDKQADRFSYSLPKGGSGTFKYDFSQPFASSNCAIMPYQPVKIEKGVDQYNTTLIYFVITDENGNKYNFTRAYSTDQQSTGYTGLEYNPHSAMTSWYLTSIITPDGTDEIDYEYSSSSTNTYTTVSYNHSTDYGGAIRPCGPGNSNSYPIADPYAVASNRSFSYTTTTEPLLTKITSATTIVQFVYSADRIDWANAKNRLTSIKVYDKFSNQLLKQIDMNNNSYFGGSSSSYPSYYDPNGTGYGGNERLKLNGVTLRGSDGAANQTYLFSYNSGTLPPYNSLERLLANKSLNFDQDYWGYYNAAKNAGLTPTEFMPPGATQYPTWGGIRKPNHDAASACMLTTITYPTGGKTNFEFEPNYASSLYYTNGNNYISGNAGGFRIKSIKIDDGAGNVITKSYGYDPGSVKLITGDLYTRTQQYYYYWSSSLCSVGGGLDYYVTGATNLAHTILQSTSILPPYLSNGTLIVYPKVTEYNGTSSRNLGKTEYFYTIPESPDQSYNSYLYAANFNDNGTSAARLLSKKEYKNDGGNYIPVTEVNNTYQLVRSNTYFTGSSVVKTSSEVQDGVLLDDAYLYDNPPGTGFPPTPFNDYVNYASHFSYINTKARDDIYLVTQSKEIQYKADGTYGMINTTTYSYNNPNHLLPTEKTVTNSIGDVYKTTYQYPLDNSTDGFASAMAGLNIQTPVIEQKTYKNDVFLSSLKTNYRYGGWLNMWLPDNIVSKVGNNNAETRVAFNKYDSYGNLLDVSKGSNGVHEVYLYGFNSTLPVAKVVGITWANLPTINQNILNSPANDQALRTELNNLRTTLASSALVSSLTYGMFHTVTSETDPSGKTLYYEYDNDGRLSLVKDDNGKILKQICYNYQGQAVSCGIDAIGNWVATGATRCKPCELDTRFFTDVKQKQQKDMATQSPTYGQLRWVDDGSDITCLQQSSSNDWKNTNTAPSCEFDYGYNTGNQLQEQKNMNPCSHLFGQTRFAVSSNTSLCPKPSSYPNMDYSGNYYSQSCTGTTYATPIYISVPIGMFTSTTSVGDANSKALQYAQNYANTHGPCSLQNFNLTISNHSTVTIIVNIASSSNAGNPMSFTGNGYTVAPGGTLTVSVPPLIYDITINSGVVLGASYGPAYEIGCGYYGNINSMGSLALYNIELSNNCPSMDFF